MAKKEEQKFKYLQMPLPEAQKKSRITKIDWCGLNKTIVTDTGVLSAESNISTDFSPYLTPSQKRLRMSNCYENPISLFGFDEFLLVVYRDGTQIKIDYRTENHIYTGILKENGATEADEVPRSIVQFNVYDTPTDPIDGNYIKKLLIFPDKKSIDFHISKNFTPADMDVMVKEYTNAVSPYLPPDTASHNYYHKNTHNQAVYKWVDDKGNPGDSGWKISTPPSMPNIKYAAVHLSRLFGVDDDRIYASGFNDYSNWNLDVADEYNESNAWCSPAQSNVKANGAFTGITAFYNHIVCFKRNYMHELYNTKNPFRVQDIYAEGCIDNRSIQEVDGNLIFAGEDNVKVYTGGNPTGIGYPLGIGKLKKAVAGTDNRKYYLYCQTDKKRHNLFVFDTASKQWAEESIDFEVLSFAHNLNGLYLLGGDGYVYQLDTANFNHAWYAETDLYLGKSIDIKHVQKIQVLAEMEAGSNLSVYLLYDDEIFDEDTSQKVFYSSSSAHRFVSIRVVPRKTANYGFKLHIGGYGFVKLYQMEINTTGGGEWNVSG